MASTDHRCCCLLNVVVVNHIVWAAADRPISAAPMPADGGGGTAAADRPVGTPDDALALRSDAWPLLIADTTFFNEPWLHFGILS